MDGPAVLRVGRDETPRRQWTQAIILGVLVDLFLAPSFGFPIMSGGTRFGLFFAAILAFGVVCVLLVRFLRRNRGVSVYPDRVGWVDGARRGELGFDGLRGARYDPSSRKLELIGREEEVRLRLSPAEGLAVVNALRAPLSRRGPERGGAGDPPRSSG